MHVARRSGATELGAFEVRAASRLWPRALPLLLKAVKATTGRGYGFCCRRIATLTGHPPAELRFEDGSIFRFSVFDSYWNYFFAPGFVYEPEIARVLRALRGQEFVFLDCGANLGFWSVLASSEPFGARRVVAVEASADTYAKLEQNRALNGDRFETVRAAVHSEAGRALRFSTGRHSGRHVSETGADAVTSTTIDALLGRPSLAGARRAVIKLDVEGAEAAAIEGFSRACDIDFMIVYEDHGREDGHDATRAIRDRLDVEIFHVDDAGGCAPLADLDALAAIKRSRTRGYNFFACRRAGDFHRALANRRNPG